MTLTGPGENKNTRNGRLANNNSDHQQHNAFNNKVTSIIQQIDNPPGASRPQDVADCLFDWYEYDDLDGNTAATTIAVDIASSLGVLCVNSAGNEGDDPWYYICTPADADSIISVGAVNRDGTIANFSSRGPTYDLSLIHI